ncbi:MAG: ABC transporter ATP-binding protein [Bradymonadaceae bacterium]
MTTIRVDNVAMRHQGESVLRDINLTVEDEEYLGLVGPGGAGKSLLLKIIAGLVEPDRGRVEIDGVDIQALSEADRDQIRQRIGMLFQNYALFDFMTVAENIAFPLHQAAETGQSSIDRRDDQLLDEIGLPHARDQYPKELSGGMKKRVSFARAVVRQPPLLLYDDPTAGLDPVTSSKIFRLLQKLRQNHPTTAVTVSHDLSGIREISDRIAMLDGGELIFVGTLAEVDASDNPTVREFWEGHDIDAVHQGADSRGERR